MSDPNIIYDNSVFTVYVYITDDGAGNLISRISYALMGADVTGCIFSNRINS